MNYELRAGSYQGPLQTLLELIEAKKLEITEISLAQVTADFFRHLQILQTENNALDAEALPVSARPDRPHLRLLVDFIVIASRLILIKSKSLLPNLTLTPAEEADIRDLESRLKIYRDLKPAIKILTNLWRRKEQAFSRPYLMHLSVLAGRTDMFYPGGNVTAPSLRGALAKLLENLEKLAYETRVIQDKIISLDEEMRAITARMDELKISNFTYLAADRSRAEVIVSFLAILHLARDQVVALEQEAHFSDIMIKKI